MTNTLFTLGSVAVANINNLASEQALCCGEAARIRRGHVEVKATVLAMVFGALPSGRLRAWYPVTRALAAYADDAAPNENLSARRLAGALWLGARALG